MYWYDGGGGVFVNNKEISGKDFDGIIGDLRNHIVTEYAQQHLNLAKIWPDSECTLRVIMVKLPQENPFNPSVWKNIVSYARFGTSVSGGASNLSSGGIGVGFDFETGKFNDFGIRYKKFCKDDGWICSEHPDTGIKWIDEYLPNWEYVRNKVEHVCNHISSLDYLGFDIIITPNGLKFCEINTHPATDYEQIMCEPILQDEMNAGFFRSKGLFEIDTERFFELYAQSQ